VHDLQLALDPKSGHISATDRVLLPARPPTVEVSFLLHAGLEVEVEGAALTEGRLSEGPVPRREYRLAPDRGRPAITIRYTGRIADPLVDISDGQSRPQLSTTGYIGEEGVYLDGNSGWYPDFGYETLTFGLIVQLPPGWRAVSQGGGQSSSADQLSRWRESQPQDQIYLVAAPFREYRKATPWGEALVFLRADDRRLAQRYLDATARYLDLYSRLLGPYPYQKFALVENFWESGYGMPSFTLLGPKVIRLPFILHTSYPHEILHNWWGNSVLVDYPSGNWAEGLTAYLADHLVAEQEGRGVEYRRDALQKFTDYVAESRDFPLRAFRARHGEVSQAVGYSKALMFFHMLRQALGDEVFLQGLRDFYRLNRFQTARFDDLKLALQEASGQTLDPEFDQWLDRVGAPRLAVEELSVSAADNGFRLQGVLRQTQSAPSYRLRVPIAVDMDGKTRAFQTHISIEDEQTAFDLLLPNRPLQLEVDPEFDVFRRLSPAELPSTIGQLFGAENLTLVLPAAAPKNMRDAYDKLATTWAARSSDTEVVWDEALRALPTQGAVWILGWENRFRAAVADTLANQVQAFTDYGVNVGGTSYARDQYSLVVTARGQNQKTSAWLGAQSPAAVSALTRKLPHYGKYSYLAFSGERASNTLKGQWEVAHSPLKISLSHSENSPSPMRLAPRPALSALGLTPK
jgi:hypothetical protein